MTNSVAIHQQNSKENPVSAAMQNVLANTYGLYLATHNYHWNVEGKDFFPLHKLFEMQYNELFEAVDKIAERIRSIGEYALPFEGSNILEISKLTSNALNKETKADDRANRMVHNLISLNEAVIKECQIAKEAAQKASDDETENLIVERITTHQKALWMLKSIES